MSLVSIHQRGLEVPRNVRYASAEEGKKERRVKVVAVGVDLQALPVFVSSVQGLFKVILQTEARRLTRASSITRVFTTSRGVVTAAATPPAIIPHTAASPGDGLLPERYLRESWDLSAS